MTPYYLAFFTAILWGAASSLEKAALFQMSPLMAVFLRSIAITVCITMIVGFTNNFGSISKLPLRTTIFIAVAGILSAVIGQYLYFCAMKLAPASKVVPIAGTYPLFAALFAALFLGERITIYNAIGIILVIAGVGLVRS